MNLHYSFKTDWKLKDLVVAVDRLYKTNNSSIIFALIWDLFQQDSRQRSCIFFFFHNPFPYKSIRKLNINMDQLYKNYGMFILLGYIRWDIKKWNKLCHQLDRIQVVIKNRNKRLGYALKETLATSNCQWKTSREILQRQWYIIHLITL